MEPLRDRVVTGLLQASLVCILYCCFSFFVFFLTEVIVEFYENRISQDGLLRVILDGGPSRVFSVADAKLLEEDLEILKVFKIVLVGYARE